MTTDENATQTPTRAQAEKAVGAMLSVANARENLATRLKVAHYATWRARFDGMKGLHASAGIANAKLFRDSDSENTLVVLADIPDFRNALDWAKGGWRTAIPADEVVGSPTVYFGADPGQEATEGEETFNASQVSLKYIAHFQVTDYDGWYELYLKMENSRGSGGLTNANIFRGSEEENDLLVLTIINGGGYRV
jgi:hypothetical protein